MIRTRQLMAVGMIFGLVGMVGLSAAEPTSIKKIMASAKGILGTVGSELKAKDKADWEKIHAAAKEFVPLAKDLGMNKPPKGDEKSWEKLTKAYLDNVTKLEEAAGKKDMKGTVTAAKAIGGSCGACHKAHK